MSTSLGRGFGTDADVARTKDAGFHEHLTKPIMISRLEETLLSGPWNARG